MSIMYALFLLLAAVVEYFKFGGTFQKVALLVVAGVGGTVIYMESVTVALLLYSGSYDLSPKWQLYLRCFRISICALLVAYLIISIFYPSRPGIEALQSNGAPVE